MKINEIWEFKGYDLRIGECHMVVVSVDAGWKPLGSYWAVADQSDSDAW